MKRKTNLRVFSIDVLSSQIDSSYYFMYIVFYSVLSVCFSLYYVHSWYTLIPKEVARSPETGVTDFCEPSQGCWMSNPAPLEGNLVLFTTEPCLQPLKQITH